MNLFDKIRRMITDPPPAYLFEISPLGIAPMVSGGLIQHLWKRFSPVTEEVYDTPLASGFITGEALVLLFLAAASFK